jgi:hypothetical protein
MSKFKRPLEILLPRYKIWRAEELARRKREAELGLSEVADFDFY